MLQFRGLSGIDSALFVLLTVQLAGTKGRSMAAVAICLLGAFVLKTYFEIAFNDTIFVDSHGAFVPVPLAHAVGGAVGLLVALSCLRIQRREPADVPGASAIGLGRRGRFGMGGL